MSGLPPRRPERQRYEPGESSRARQVGALPWRKAENGIELLLVTSRESGRWLLPKGNRMIGRSGRKAAAIEAEEEAGVRGMIARQPIGSFRYWKRNPGRERWVVVDVFPLKVGRELTRFKEMHERRRAWFAPEAAAAAVSDPDLARFLGELDPDIFR